MLRLFIIIMALLCVSLPGEAGAQGVLDSIFGSGGIGIWGGGGQEQFNSQQYYGGTQQGTAPETQFYGQNQAGAQMSYPPPGYGQQPYGPQGYNSPYSQPGVYSDWHTQQPAILGQQGDQQYAAPPQQQYAAPPQQQQYGAPPQQQQYPAPPQQQYAPPPTASRTPAAQRGPAPTAPLRPGQYSSQQAPPPPVQQPAQVDPNSADGLPPGAVRMTTTTPEGTTVHFYAPGGSQDQSEAVGAPARAQRTRTQRTRKPQAQQQQQPQAQESTGSEGAAVSSIAMPKPVEIPKTQDPRAGWDGAVNRGGSGPRAR
ncbi:MAG: hypothetical protein HY914_02680 [Desulfomonile tiedjei]|nr:hypothetical protein [Desulfomonile tiedjei]